MRLPSKRVLVAAACAFSLAACGGQSNQSSAPQAAGSPAALTNPTDIPLGTGSTVLDVKPFSQTVTASSGTASPLTTHGAGTYAGQEVLAGTTASDADLKTWLDGLRKTPPSGYAVLPASNAAVSAKLAAYSIDFAVFRKTDPGVTRGVVVVIMDPKIVKDKLGLAISLVDTYRALPQAMRQPIDDKLKTRIGFSATDATDPSAPLGMTLGALRTLQSSDQRAIVVVDATKK